jgi:galactose oxidase
VLGGSWSGGLGGKNGEVFTPAGAGAGWRKLSNVPVAPILTKDPEGVYRADNHGWFFGWSGGKGASRGCGPA